MALRSGAEDTKQKMSSEKETETAAVKYVLRRHSG